MSNIETARTTEPVTVEPEIDIEDFVDKVTREIVSGAIIRTVQDPRVRDALRYLIEHEGRSSTYVANIWRTTRNVIISMCNRAKPPVLLSGVQGRRTNEKLIAVRNNAPTGQKRKHVAATDNDLTRAVKFTRLVDAVNRRAEQNKMALAVACPKCRAAVEFTCTSTRNGTVYSVRPHAERLRRAERTGSPSTPDAPLSKGVFNYALSSTQAMNRKAKFHAFNNGVARCCWGGCNEPKGDGPYCAEHTAENKRRGNAL